MRYNKNIIIALDFLDINHAKDFVKKISPNLCRVKVGKALFTLAGPDFVKWLQDKGFDVFLDLKFHDIPNTVYQACIVATGLEVWMLTVHLAGGHEMLQAAKKGIADACNFSNTKPLLIGVTVLTSFNTENLHSIGVVDNLENQVLRMANIASDCKIDGIVCSGFEVPLLKAKYKNVLKFVTPGIILNDNRNASADQKRIMTPTDALRAGSDYLVIGRAITAQLEPNIVLQKIVSSIETI